MALPAVIDTEVDPNDQQSIAESLLPDDYGGKRSRYLALRACGFKFREACRLTPVHNATVWSWRQIPEFTKMEADSVDGLRDKLVKEHLTLEFTRNYAMVLMKDYKVLEKAVDGTMLSKQDHDYLLKARSHYTPQQLQILKELAMLGEGSKDIKWADIILRATRTETIEVVR